MVIDSSKMQPIKIARNYFMLAVIVAMVNNLYVTAPVTVSMYMSRNQHNWKDWNGWLLSHCVVRNAFKSNISIQILKKKIIIIITIMNSKEPPTVT